MQINIYIKSKNKKYIIEFIRKFKVISRSHFKSTKLYFSKKGCKNFFSILTSPHVNKKAQEQFEIRKCNFQFKVKSFEPLKLIILLKRICSNLFPNLNFKINLNSFINKRYLVIDTKTLKKKLQNRGFSQKKLLKVMDNIGV